MTMYEKIRQLRIDAGMSQDDLAHAMGYKDRSMITKIESGKVDISQKKIIAFAKILNTTTAYLMGNEDPDASDEYYRTLSDLGLIQSPTAKIISAGVSRMPLDKQKKALQMMQLAFDEYADFFKEETPNDDT